MDITNALFAVRMIYDGLIKGKPDFAQLPPFPSKTSLLLPEKESFFKRARPARVGVDGEKLLSFARTLSESREANVHAVTVVSHGKCVFEAAKTGYSTEMPHAAFSLSKTLTGLAVGMLIDDKKLSLDAPVLSFFPELKGKRVGAKFKLLTVSHLLSMSVDVPFNEIGVVTSDSYTKSFFESALRGTPGDGFSYNSMCSYILAVIVTRVAECSLSDFLKERLFTPMGIRNYFWEKSSEGVEKGGWGLYLSTKSMAKLGALLLNGGVWEGRRLVSESFVSQMTRRQTAVPDAIGEFDYGYHLWRHKKNESFLLNGMLGQNVWVHPGKKLVVAITSGDNCLFQDSIALVSAMRELSDMTGRDTKAARKERRRIARHFGEDASLIPPYVSEENRDAKERLLPLLEGRFVLPENNGGILPLITRLIQNSPTKGIGAITVTPWAKRGELLFSFTEGSVTYHITAGNCRFLYGVLRIHGEKYRVAAAYAFGLDINREPYLRLELRFPALASTRRFLFRREENGFSVSLTEQPGYEFVTRVLKNAAADKAEFFETLTRSKSPAELLLRRVKGVFSPTLPMTRAKRKGKSKATSGEEKNG